MSEKVPNSAGVSQLWTAVKDRSLPVKTVTQAEYDALTDEQKQNGLYFISDRTGVLNGVDNYQVYSKKETVVGKWYNGKPVYRIVITGHLPSINSWYNTVNIPIDEIVATGGYIGVSDGDKIAIGGSLSGVRFDSATKYVQLAGYNNILLNQLFAFWVDYTKTTD